MRHALTVAAFAVLLGCAPAVPPPEAISRDIPGQGAPDDEVATLDDGIKVDGGVSDFDAGVCCMVAFALPVETDEVEAELVMGTSQEHHPLTQAGTSWSTSLCMPLVDQYYFYEVKLSTGEEDGGLFVSTRVNFNAPVASGSSISQLNEFQSDGAQACSQLDAGVHADTQVRGADGGL